MIRRLICRLRGHKPGEEQMGYGRGFTEIFVTCLRCGRSTLLRRFEGNYPRPRA